MIALPMKAHQRLANLVAELWNHPVRVKLVPDFSALVFTGATFESLGEVPLIGLREPAIDDFNRFVKRLLDVTLSLVFLVLLSPVLLAIAILIKLDSAGAVLYRQQRVGENGRLFWMYKFRTVVPDADQHLDDVVQTTSEGDVCFRSPQTDVIHKVKDDPRVTRVGRLLRQFSLGALPLPEGIRTEVLDFAQFLSMRTRQSHSIMA